MKHLNSTLRLSFLFLILFYLTGCAPRVELSGNLPNTDLLDSIEIGHVNKQEVLKLIGTPSTISPFSGNDWYYVSERTETSAFFNPNNSTTSDIISSSSLINSTEPDELS